jgi:uncharacterized membrane protein (DUF485 family)
MTLSQRSNPESLSSAKDVGRKLPSGIWVLGFVSLFMDISSELVHSLLPIFMTTVLGASVVTVGIIEGVAEAIAATTKVFSGAASDYFRKRKLLAVIGYALGALTKPIFPLATTIGWVFGARFVDRIGKGIRGAPRDALIADITPSPLRGAAWPAPGARFSRGLYRATTGDYLYGCVYKRHQSGVVGSGDPCLHRGIFTDFCATRTRAD